MFRTIDFVDIFYTLHQTKKHALENISDTYIIEQDELRLKNS